jgi:hypothetical protein
MISGKPEINRQNLTLATRTEKIKHIIEQRRPLAQKIEAVEQNLRSLSRSLENLEQHRQRLISKVEDLKIKGCLQEIDCLTLQRDIETEIAALSKLKVRFYRDTINIGVIGRARQGKSRLLQSLTGLTTAEIPTGDRQHCTGVRSTIHHNPNVDTYGEVWFHSERSFLEEVLAPYYEKLHLGAKPINLAEFAQNPLPALPKTIANNAVAGAMYEHLSRYHTNLEKYRHLLQEPSPRRISKEEIREYVAQDTVDGQRIYFNYLAVKEAKIVCTFPNSDAGQIALIDMPGLGDTGLGDEARLLKILGQDVDIVLFIRLPKPPGDFWADVDVQLYDTASAALTDIPIKLWSFLILNHTNANSPIGDNFVYCQDLADSREDKHLYVVDCITANCAVPEEANRQILDPVLDYLISNITSLDRQYTSSCQDRLLRLQSEVAAQIDKARQALYQGTEKDNWFPLFIQLFDQLWDDLTSGLEELLQELKEQRDLQDFDFKQQIEAALQACREDTGIPSEEEIGQKRNSVGGYPNAYYEYLNEVRAHLSQHFLLLDEGLKRPIERVKARVAEVLVKRGRLGELTEVRGAQFLTQITELIPEQLSQLKLGFQILANFSLSYRGLIQHRIRQHLDDLTPDTTSLQLSPSPSASEVLSCLESLHAEALYQCETALDDLLAEPNQAAFAIVEEFLDRILRAKEVKNQWLIFLEELRSEIWSTEFEQLGERTRMRREWLDSVEQVTTANQLSAFQFLDYLSKGT